MIWDMSDVQHLDIVARFNSQNEVRHAIALLCRKKHSGARMPSVAFHTEFKVAKIDGQYVLFTENFSDSPGIRGCFLYGVLVGCDQLVRIKRKRERRKRRLAAS